VWGPLQCLVAKELSDGNLVPKVEFLYKGTPAIPVDDMGLVEVAVCNWAENRRNPYVCNRDGTLESIFMPHYLMALYCANTENKSHKPTKHESLDLPKEWSANDQFLGNYLDEWRIFDTANITTKSPLHYRMMLCGFEVRRGRGFPKRG
jgi:hypothetical protein